MLRIQDFSTGTRLRAAGVSPMVGLRTPVAAWIPPYGSGGGTAVRSAAGSCRMQVFCSYCVQYVHER